MEDSRTEQSLDVPALPPSRYLNETQRALKRNAERHGAPALRLVASQLTRDDQPGPMGSESCNVTPLSEERSDALAAEQLAAAATFEPRRDTIWSAVDDHEARAEEAAQAARDALADRQLREAIATLPKDWRPLARLVLLKGLNLTDAAKRCELSISTAQYRLDEITKRLNARLGIDIRALLKAPAKRRRKRGTKRGSLKHLRESLPTLEPLTAEQRGLIGEQCPLNDDRDRVRSFEQVAREDMRMPLVDSAEDHGAGTRPRRIVADIAAEPLTDAAQRGDTILTSPGSRRLSSTPSDALPRDDEFTTTKGNDQ